MQTNNCLQLFLLNHARNGFFSQSVLDQFNKIAKNQITKTQLNNAGFYLVTSLSTKVTNWLKM